MTNLNAHARSDSESNRAGGDRIVGAAWGPTLSGNWASVGPADFNNDGRPEYVLYSNDMRQTAIRCLNRNVFVGCVASPTIPIGWSLAALTPTGS